MHPHFGLSLVTPARELLWKVSSGPSSGKVARLCARHNKGPPESPAQLAATGIDPLRPAEARDAASNTTSL